MLIYALQAKNEYVLGTKIMGYLRRGYEVIEIVVNTLDTKNPYKAFLLNRNQFDSIGENKNSVFLENANVYKFRSKIPSIYRNLVESKINSKCCFKQDKFIEEVYLGKKINMSEIEDMFSGDNQC
jgi:hypothetical protein